MGDENRIMIYVKEKAARDWARLSTPFENGFGPSAASNAKVSSSGIVPLPSDDNSSLSGAATQIGDASVVLPNLSHLHPVGHFGEPSPQARQPRRAARPAPDPDNLQSLQLASAGVGSSKLNPRGSSNDKSQQWKEELEKELAAERARNKSPLA